MAAERSNLAEYAPQILTEDEKVSYNEPLQSLVQAVGWPLFAEILKRFRIQAREGLEVAGSIEEVRHAQGVIEGLRLAENTPALVLKEAGRVVEKEDAAADQRRRGQIPAGGDASF